jgi:8-oxo-dGTP diphosphatase
MTEKAEKLVNGKLRKPTVTVVAAIIVEEGKILIGKRKEGLSMAHKWEFPGGKLKQDESPEECLKRELQEELEIEAEIGRFYCKGTYNELTLLTYMARFVSGDFKLHDHEEIRWVSPHDLSLYEFPHADRPIVMKLMEEGHDGSQ